MKTKLFKMLAMSAMMIAGFTSCTDDKNDTGSDNVNELKTGNMADYTVIVWGDGGNLDANVLSDFSNLILERENGTIGNNVNLVGCLSPSTDLQQVMSEIGLGNVITFELGEKRNISADTLSYLQTVNTPSKIEGAESKLSEEQKISFNKEMYDKVMHSMKNVSVDNDIQMDKSSALASFIKKAAAEHPAHNYVVYFVNHGIGYNPALAGNGNNVRESVFINPAGVEQSIKESGVKIQSIVFNACNMATLENLSTLKGCADYVMASSESIYSGFFTNYITNISAAGNSVDKMKEASKKTVDYYKSVLQEGGMTSMGFYDMSYTDNLMASVKKAGEWFSKANVSNTAFMEDVVEGTIYAEQQPAIEATMENGKYLKYYYDSRKTIREMLQNDDQQMSAKDFCEIMKKIIAFMHNNMTYHYCFADMMQTALDLKNDETAKGLDFNSLQSIYDQYVSTLGQMAYIRCTYEKTADEGYKLASPSVNLFTMNEEGYTDITTFFTEDEKGRTILDSTKIMTVVSVFLNCKDEEQAEAYMRQVLGGCNYANLVDLSTIKNRYKSTAFDQATGWSQVLESLPTNPFYMLNPQRCEKTGMINEFLNQL